jgi:glutamate racemase
VAPDRPRRSSPLAEPSLPDFPAAPVIGIFDSGVGGLSVLRHLRALLPHQPLLYFADQAHVPYGPRPAAQVQRFGEEISRFLLARDAALIVVACNTASAAALGYLRERFSTVPFVGMEPAVKPGAGRTRTGRIGVLATAGTFGSQRYADLMARYAQGVAAYEDPCPGLVEQIEAGDLESAETESIIRRAIEPMLADGVDTLVLGCTHYPFVQPLIQRLAGPGVAVIDPAPAVALQVERRLDELGLRAAGPQPAPMRAVTTGDPARFFALAARLLGKELPTAGARWSRGGVLTAAGDWQS